MKRICLLFAATLLFVFSSCDILGDKENKEEVPVVTGESADITMDSVTLYGSVSSDYATGAEVGFIIITTISTNSSSSNNLKIVAEKKDGNNLFSAQVKGLEPSTVYYYKAYVNKGSLFEGEMKQFVTESFRVSGVDLGLSVKWANANVGAGAPGEFGDYFAWGETTTKTENSYGNYKWWSDGYFTLTKYNNLEAYGLVDNKIDLEPEDDAARANLGKPWRIPTVAEMRELLATRDYNPNYRWTWKKANGNDGWEIVYLVNGNSIFIPAAGYRAGTTFYGTGSNGGASGNYWSASINTEIPFEGWCFVFDSIYTRIYGMARYSAFSIRAVID